MRVKLVSMTSSAGATASTVSNRMMMMLWSGFLPSLPVRPPRLTLIEPSFEMVVGVLIEGGFGTDGVVTTGVATAGAAPAAVSDTLAHPHASAQIGSPITTRMRRSHVRVGDPPVLVWRGSAGSVWDFGTETLPGS